MTIAEMDESRSMIGVYKLLNQSDVWVDVKQRRHRVEEMSVRYKRNVIAFLERQAEHLETAYLFGQVAVVVAVGLPREGTAAFDIVTDELDCEVCQFDEEPLHWLRRTPLFSRLIEDVAAGRGGSDD